MESNHFVEETRELFSEIFNSWKSASFRGNCNSVVQWIRASSIDGPRSSFAAHFSQSESESGFDMIFCKEDNLSDDVRDVNLIGGDR